MERIVNDFDNHIRNEFIMLRDKVHRLNTDRAGSHSPFRELREAFFVTNQKVKYVSESGGSGKDSIYPMYLKLIADSVISKLYVHSIAKTFPEGFHPENYKIRNEKDSDRIPLRQYRGIFELLQTNGKVITSSGATKIPGPGSKIDEKLFEKSIISPVNCGYLWCCAFIALYYNAVNHGRGVLNANDEYEVDVEVTCDSENVYISNLAKDNAAAGDVNGVTLDALRYYFDNYYEKDLFKIDVGLNGNGIKYCAVQIPIGCRFEETEE